MADAATRVARQVAHAALLPLLYKALTGQSAPLTRSARLGGLLDLLSTDRSYPEAAASLLDGSARWAALWPDMRSRLPAEGHHHLALLALRSGWDALDDDPSAATRSFLAALEAFARVVADPNYIAQWRAAAGLGAERLDPIPWILAPHAQWLREAVAEPASFHARRAGVHWMVLERAGDRLGSNALSVARALQTEIVELALAQAVELASQTEPLQASDAELIAPLHLLRDLTGGIGIQEDISIWALESAVGWAWPLYKTRELDRLRVLMEAVRPFGMHVEELLVRNEGAFGRQSLCADFLLFLADNAPFEEQDGLFLRGLKVCPGHRNSRLMLSYHRLRQAHAALVKAEAPAGLSEMVLGRRQFRETVASARALVDEAEALFEPNPKIDDYRKRVQALEKRV